MKNLILLIAGFAMLIKGADVFVESSSSIAKRLKIPSIIIAMTLVAMGTSAPELSVSVTSSLAGMNDMSVANVVGSNVFNILMALGLCGMISKLKIINFKDVKTLLVTCLTLLVLSLDGVLGLFDGLILLLAFATFVYDMIKKAKNNNEEVEEEAKQRNIFLTIVLGLLGLGAVVLGGDLVVNSASAIAKTLGMSENLVGLTIVAVGTSLPEFVTSVIATKKGEIEIAIGNVIGSNIFNVLLILGVASTITPITISLVTLIDIIFMVSTVILLILMTFKKKEINKYMGIPMVMIYVAYIIFTIVR
jgi:cation:H+ antiporter